MMGRSLTFAASTVALLAVGCTQAPPFIEATTVLTSTSDTTGPYVVHSVVVGVDGESVELSYLADERARFIPVLMVAADDEERFRGEIPGQPSGTEISYYVAVVRDGERIAADPETAGAQPYVFRIE
jgi:hypothetical protein